MGSYFPFMLWLAWNDTDGTFRLICDKKVGNEMRTENGIYFFEIWISSNVFNLSKKVVGVTLKSANGVKKKFAIFSRVRFAEVGQFFRQGTDSDVE